eukprot:443770-Pelagomonas_calceolata.AAC.7
MSSTLLFWEQSGHFLCSNSHACCSCGCRNGAGLVKVVFGDDGNVTSFVYPTLARMPDDDTDNEATDMDTDKTGNETDADEDSRRKLLNEHG